MQNSKVNTVLLVVLIILVAVGLWFTMGKKDAEVSVKEDTSQVSAENSQNTNSTQSSQNIPAPKTEKQYSDSNLHFSYASNASVKTISGGKVEVSVGVNDPYAETVGFYSVELPFDVNNYTKLPSEKHGDTTFEVYQATESGTRVYLVRNGRQAIVVTVPFRAGGNDTTKYVDLASISL